MGKTRRGGMAQWREGVDTCVFKPAVKCEGDVERPSGISRIRRRNSARRDIAVETRIRDAFPQLVEKKLVSVYSRACVPEYEVSDDEYDVPEDRRSDGCSKLGDINPGPEPDHINLVTDKWAGELYDYLFPDEHTDLDQLMNWRSAIRGASWAAVQMVPDAGPWIVHTDCHFGNVLYRRITGGGIKTGLADWGRTLIIENPNDIASVRQGIREWVLSLTYLQPRADWTDNQIRAAISRIGGRPQHPRHILNAVALLMAPHTPEVFATSMAKIRGWVLYVLVKQCVDAIPETEHDRVFVGADRQTPSVEALLTARDNTALRHLRTDLLNPEEAAPAEGGMYWPAKYHRGLTRRQNAQRKRSATRRTKMKVNDPKAYVPWLTDKKVKTRRSSYTQRFHKKYPDAKTLPEIAKATGISKATLQTVYDRGMAAWRTGHRPGASQHAWGMARVHSFVMKGKTYRTADADLAKQGHTQ